VNPLDAVRAEALFCSGLRPADMPDGSLVRGSIDATLTKLGAGECAARMAQAYGDDQASAARRMGWCCEQVKAAYALSPA
jgi:hypothetical protein